jgi:ATP/maltotriose-dependent transcriptional regulator MalT
MLEGALRYAEADAPRARRAVARRVGVPRLSAGSIPRDHLIAALDAVPPAALTVLQAGSGFGKTSLLAEWARRRPADEPLVWVSGEDAVRDPVGFWREVLHGMVQTGVLTGGDAALLDEGDADPETLTAALRRLFSSLVSPVALIIDSFDRLDDPAIDRTLVDILLRTEFLRVMVASRVPTELATATTASRLDTLVMDSAALRFTDQEVRRLSTRLGVAASQDELRELHAYLGGWPFGIRAVLERHRRRESTTTGPSARRIGPGISKGASAAMDAGYVTAHLLESLGGLDGLEMLAVTTVRESFTLEQAAVLGAPLAGHPVLDALQSRGMGSWQLDADPPEYRLHPALRRALNDRLDEDRATAAVERLARWHAARGEFAAAFEAALRARDWALAARCVRSDLLAVLVHLHLHPDLIARAPRSVLKREPALMLVTGITHLRLGHHAKAVRMLLAAVAAFDAQRSAVRGPVTADQVWMQGAQTIALRLAGRYELLPAALRRYSQMLDAMDDPEGRFEADRVLFRTEEVVALSLLDHLDSAEHLALDIVRERQPLSPFHRANLQGLTAFAHARRGDPARAAAVLASLGETVHADGFFDARTNIASAWVSLERFDTAAARHALQLTDEHWHTTEYWPFILEAGIQLEWQLHGPEAALVTLREGRAEKRFQASTSDAMVMLLVALEAELLLAAGRGSEAIALLTTSRLHRSARLEVPRSRSLLLAGNWDQAAGVADHLALSEAQPWNNRIDLMLISASANLHAGDRETAQRRFDQAASMAERTGVRIPFASLPRRDLLELGRLRPALVGQIPEQSSRYPEPEVVIPLSRREHHVLAELAGDQTLPEIARTLSVSTNTLKSQLRSVYRKLGVGNRQEAVALARRTGLLRLSLGHHPDRRTDASVRKTDGPRARGTQGF